MDSADLLGLLDAASTVGHFVEGRLLSRVPWIFETAELFAGWRNDVGAAARVRPEDIYIVGSAATGFSLSPTKPGRPFQRLSPGTSRASDIDVALVGRRLFDEAWEQLLAEDRHGRLGRQLPSRGDISKWQQLSKLRTDVYWGTISHGHTIAGSRTGQRIRLTLAAVTRRAPLAGYYARIRIYRRRSDLVAYHEQSLRRLVNSLRHPGDQL